MLLFRQTIIDEQRRHGDRQNNTRNYRPPFVADEPSIIVVNIHAP